MVSNRFYTGIFVRVAALVSTMAILAWIIFNKQWYVNIGLFVVAALVQAWLLLRYSSQSSREVARFLDAVSFDDTTQSFSGLAGDGAFRDLGLAMTRVLDQLRKGRADREEQAQHVQAVIAHVPVALVTVDTKGKVQLLNFAARRLFEKACGETSEFSRYGEVFAAGMEQLRPGDGAILRMERASGALQLKAAATDYSLGGVRRRLISLQNIETELTAHELAAWQTVIRVMAHEVMNSLTPVSSLSATARELVDDVIRQMQPDDPHRASLADASEALDTLTRRSEGLLHFVQNHRRLTKRMVAQLEIVPVRRIFARLQRLLAGDLAARNIRLESLIEPETLEMAIDSGTSRSGPYQSCPQCNRSVAERTGRTHYPFRASRSGWQNRHLGCG